MDGDQNFKIYPAGGRGANFFHVNKGVYVGATPYDTVRRTNLVGVFSNAQIPSTYRSNYELHSSYGYKKYEMKVIFKENSS